MKIFNRTPKPFKFEDLSNTITYTWKDKVIWYWNDFIFCIFIPKDYAARHKILLRLYNKHRLTEQEQLSKDWHSTLMELEDIPFLSLTLTDVKLYIWSLIDSGEIHPIYFPEKTLIQKAAINIKGLSAVSTDKYIWEGLSTRVSRTKLFIAFITVFIVGQTQLITKSYYLLTKLYQSTQQHLKEIID